MGGAPCIIQVMDDHDLVLKHGDVGIAYDLRSLHIIVDWLVQGIVPGLLGIVIASHNP